MLNYNDHNLFFYFNLKTKASIYVTASIENIRTAEVLDAAQWMVLNPDMWANP